MVNKKEVDKKPTSSLHAEENHAFGQEQHPSRTTQDKENVQPDIDNKNHQNPYRQHYYKRESDDDDSSQGSQPPKKRMKRAKNLDWKMMYDRLVAYKAEFGSVRVPQGYKADPELGRWVHGQRYHCKCQIKRTWLDKMGFEWKPIKITESREWMDVYKRLIAYKNRCGHANVPQRWKEDIALGRWVHRQRYDCKDPERIDLLNAIGYDWLPPKERKWMDMYDRLVKYQKTFHTTDVDRSKDKNLSLWANIQRHNCTNERRASLLTKIDFDWPELTI